MVQLRVILIDATFAGVGCCGHLYIDWKIMELFNYDTKLQY